MSKLHLEDMLKSLILILILLMLSLRLKEFILIRKMIKMLFVKKEWDLPLKLAVWEI